MAAKIFNYYDDWKNEVFECPRCGWRGTFDEGSVEYHSQLMDCSCRRCDVWSAPMLAIVSYPTMAEIEANWDRASEADKAWVSGRKKFLAAWEAWHLTSGDQLPDLEDPSILLSWVLAVEGDDRYTVIRHGDREIWRELACFEGYERFEEIAQILSMKYGQRLADLVPTPGSETYLYGDYLGAISFVESARISIREGHGGGAPEKAESE